MNNYLIHYGVSGQKWGKRNYQYEDGSLTPEGRVHYGVGERKSINSVRPRKARRQVQKTILKENSRSEKHGTKLFADSYSKANETEAGKQYQEIKDNIQLAKDYGKATGTEFLFTKQFVDELNELDSNYMSEVKSFFDKGVDEWASVVLDELGYEDTQDGRDYITPYLYEVFDRIRLN